MKSGNKRDIILAFIKSGVFGSLLCFSAISAAQAPGGGGLPTATPAATPPAYINTNINYIRTWEPSMPTADPAVVSSGSRTVSEVKQTTQYFDGLGRPLQTVSKGTSAGGKDVVAPVVYDEFGREQFKYLPYAAQTANDGKFKTNPFTDQKAFYQNSSLMPGTAGESIYYGRTDYEASPLNRVLKTYAPGNSWAKNDPSTVERGGNHPVQSQYQVNAIADSVRIWTLAAGGIIPASSSIYGAGQLYKNVVIDEATNQVVEYKDKEGRVVMKKVQLSVSPGSAHMGWLCTYYVYDDLGNLRFVLPPKAVTAVISNWVVSAAVAAELCFIYRYDGRNRMIVKKVPGADSTEIVYDVRDRLAFSRDGNMRNGLMGEQNDWLVTFYDELNRPVMTAIYKTATATSREALQASLNGATSNTQNLPYTFPGVADLVLGVYDDRPLYQATNSITLTDGFDTGTGSEMVAEISASATNGSISVSVTNPLPNIPSSAITPLTYTFYGKYDFAGKQNYFSGDITRVQAGGNPYAEALPSSASNMITGMVTGTKVRVLGTDQWLTTTNYYNDKGRSIQIITDNISGGQDITTTLYDFNGKVLSTYGRHRNQRSGTTPETRVLTTMAYDVAGRLVNIKKKLNDTEPEKTIVANEYDELGQLKSKRLGVITTSQLEKLNYEYNIRGWLKSINKDFVNTNNSTTNWFGQDLSYDYGFTASQYNGNIAGAKWKSRSDGKARAYGYGYDKANRLLVADFTQQNGSNWDKNAMDFTVNNLSYDANGNIGTMSQKGLVGTSSPLIDQLTYTYQPNSNKLIKVTDPMNTATAKLGDFINGTNTGDDYSYDANGNLIEDENKKISGIVYNHLNLPQSIAITGKGNITCLYDAAGNKLRKTVTDNTSTPARVTTTDYIDGFVYQNDTLQFAAHEEGRIRAVFQTGQPVKYWYDYFVKDHLGNVRAVLTEQSDLSMYTATMETASAAKENALFSNIDNTRAAKPAGYPADSDNKSVAKLTAINGGKKIGPSLVLRVMTGDTIQIGAKAFYKSIGPQDKTAGTVPAENMLADLVQAFNGTAASSGDHSATSMDQQTLFNSNFYNNDYQHLKDKAPDGGQVNRPKAYLNYVLFDDQFNMVDDNSGVKQVKAEPDQLQTLTQDKMVIEKSGFLYVYTSNESPQDVFFDDVILGVTSGPLLEETHYYPYGLTMAGISSNALKGTNYPENKYKFNKGSELQSKEFSDGFGLELYETPLRTLDPQLGRWWQIDSKPDYMQSLYAAMSNNPILRNDPLGDTSAVPWSARTNQSSVNLLKPLGTGNGTVKKGANQENGTTTNTNNNGPNNTIANGNSATVKQTGENGKPLVGTTTTNKVSKDATLSAGILGDKITYAQSVGMVSGKEGSVITTDVSSNKGAPDGASITLLGTVTLGVSADLSISAGIGAMGHEAHLSIGVGVGLGQIGAGTSHTNANNVVSGGDLTLRPGLGTLGVIFIVPKLVF